MIAERLPPKGEAFRAVYPIYRIIGTLATGGIYAAPTSQSVIFIIIFGRGRGIPRPYRATYFYCPVGRGDPTPPGNLAVDAKLQGGVKTPPYEQLGGKQL